MPYRLFVVLPHFFAWHVVSKMQTKLLRGGNELVSKDMHPFIVKPGFRTVEMVGDFVQDQSPTYSPFHGFWQSFVTFGSCNDLMKFISRYVGNAKRSEIS